MFEYPEGKINGRTIIEWFSEVYHKWNGCYPPDSHYSRYAGLIRNLRNQGHTDEDIMTLVWGVCNTKSNVRSMMYCKYFTDKLEYYKQLLEDYNRKDDVNEEEEFVKIDMSQKEEGEDFFEELL
ncbi:MAG: hypothetical protein ACOCRO_02255 [Halanaerobiales bacterium]